MDGRGDDARDVKRTRFKLADKKAALESIGRHLGMFTDKIKVGGDRNAPPIAGKLIVEMGRWQHVALSSGSGCHYVPRAILSPRL